MENNADSTNDPLPFGLPVGEEKRQAIDSLRGYRYQLEQSLSAWLRLPEHGVLFLEVAEDFTEKTGELLDEKITATQVKDTKKSGRLTLNSKDVKEAIVNYWSLQAENPNQLVEMVFLSTSEIGAEKNAKLSNGSKGLECWEQVSKHGDVSAVKKALIHRFPKKHSLGSFLRTASDDEIRSRLLQRIHWVCGAPPFDVVRSDNLASLVELGERRGATHTSSRTASGALFDYLFGKATDANNRYVKQSDLYREFDAATSITVPSGMLAALSRSMASGSDIAIQTTATGLQEMAHPVEGVLARTGLVSKTVEDLRVGKVVWLSGPTGIGKTTIAALTTVATPNSWSLQRCIGITGEPLEQELRRMVGVVGSTPEIEGLLLDDLDADVDLTEFGAFAALKHTLERLNVPLLVTSYRSPSEGIVLDNIISRTVPYLTEEEVSKLIVLHDGEPSRWNFFIQMAGGGGHPALSALLCRSLSKRGWPDAEMKRWMSDNFQSQDITVTRDGVRRRLLNAMQPDQRRLLGRVSLAIGPITRPLALALGEVEPSVDQPGFAYESLVGPWLEVGNGDRVRVSPLVSDLGAKTLSPTETQAVHRRLVSYGLSIKTMSPDQADAILVHAFLGKCPELAWPLIANLFAPDVTDRAILARHMPFFRSLEIDRLIDFGTSPEIIMMWRLAQVNLKLNVADGDKASSGVDKLLADIDTHGDGEGSQLTCLMALSVLCMNTNLSTRYENWFAIVRRFAKLDQNPSYADTLTVTEMDFGDAVRGLFLIQTGTVSGREWLEKFIDTLDSMPTKERNRWLDILRSEARYGAMSLVFDRTWLAEVSEDNVDLPDLIGFYQRLAKTAEGWNAVDVTCWCIRARAVLTDEYLKNTDGALAILDEGIDQLGPEPILLRAKLKTLNRSGRHNEVIKIASDFPTDLTGLSVLEIAFLWQETAISSAKSGSWDLAADHFLRGATELDAARSSEADHEYAAGDPFALGLKIDAANTRFEHGDRKQAIADLAGIIPSVLALPVDELRPFWVRKIAGQSLHRFEIIVRGDEPGPDFTYVPGCGSRAELDESIMELEMPSQCMFHMILKSLALRTEQELPCLEKWPDEHSYKLKPNWDYLVRETALEMRLHSDDFDLTHNRSDYHVVNDVIDARASAIATKFFTDEHPNHPSKKAKIWPVSGAVEIGSPDWKAIEQIGLCLAINALKDADPRVSLKIIQAYLQSKSGPSMHEDLVAEAVVVVPDAVQAVANLSFKKPLDPLTLVATAMRIFETLKDEPLSAKVLGFVFEDVHHRFRMCLEERSFALLSPNVYGDSAREALSASGRNIASLARWLLAFAPMVKLNIHSSIIKELEVRSK